MSSLWLPQSAQQDKTTPALRPQDFAVYSDKLKACPPDKYVVAMAEDVILSPDEWMDLADYVTVVSPHTPPGEVHLLRKVGT